MVCLERCDDSSSEERMVIVVCPGGFDATLKEDRRMELVAGRTERGVARLGMDLERFKFVFFLKNGGKTT